MSLSAKLVETGLLRSKGLIDGKWMPAASGKTFEVNDPAVGAVVAAVSAYGEEDTKLAVSAAEKSFDAWRSKTMQVNSMEEVLNMFVHPSLSFAQQCVGLWSGLQ